MHMILEHFCKQLDTFQVIRGHSIKYDPWHSILSKFKYWFRDNVLSQICIVKNNRSIEKGLKPNRKQNN